MGVSNLVRTRPVKNALKTLLRPKHWVAELRSQLGSTFDHHKIRSDVVARRHIDRRNRPIDQPDIGMVHLHFFRCQCRLSSLTPPTGACRTDKKPRLLKKAGFVAAAILARMHSARSAKKSTMTDSCLTSARRYDGQSSAPRHTLSTCKLSKRQLSDWASPI